MIKSNDLYQLPRDGKYSNWDINDTDWADNTLKESSPSQLKINGKCVDITSWGTANGTLVELAGVGGQRNSSNTEGRLKWVL